MLYRGWTENCALILSSHRFECQGHGGVLALQVRGVFHPFYCSVQYCILLFPMDEEESGGKDTALMVGTYLYVKSLILEKWRWNTVIGPHQLQRSPPGHR